jgi:hypothetical protein
MRAAKDAAIRKRERPLRRRFVLALFLALQALDHPP